MDHEVKIKETDEKLLHQFACEQKQTYYRDNSGRIVMTSFFLKQRGFCCKPGCLWCPYKEHNGVK